MRPAASWAANHHEQRARRRVKKSSFRLVNTLSAAAHARLTQHTDTTHRAEELVTLMLIARLVQSPFVANLPKAQILRGGENVKVSRGNMDGSSSKICSLEVKIRCALAGRHSSPDI